MQRKRRDALERVPDLDEIIGGWRAEGLSFAEVAFRLRVELRITVTADTVRNWWGIIQTCDTTYPRET